MEKRDIGLINLAPFKIQYGVLHKLMDMNLEIDYSPHVRQWLLVLLNWISDVLLTRRIICLI
jgi:hypothetical protein